MKALFILFALQFLQSYKTIEITDVTEGLEEDPDEIYITDDFWDRSTISKYSSDDM